MRRGHINDTIGKTCYGKMKKVFFVVLLLGVIVLPTAIGLSTKNLLYFSGSGFVPMIVADSVKNKLPVVIDSIGLVIIPPSSGVQFYQDGIIFLSWSKKNNKMLENHFSFGNIESSYAPLTEASIGKSISFSTSSPFPFPSESLTFSKDFLQVYYSNISKEDGKVKIYRATTTSDKNNPEWLMELSPLDFCKSDNYEHPTLSSDGKTMIFSSDMSGSIGAMDLFITQFEKDVWTTPQNLGSLINTSENELFPFLDSKKNLYFSSNGPSGLGGYDIFICKFNGTGWDNPLNLGKTVNTSEDDVAFTLHPDDDKYGFYTTRKLSGTRRMQLYKISLDATQEKEPTADLTTTLYNIALTESAIAARDKSLAAGKDAERLRKEELERERLEMEKLAKERLEKERLEREKLEREKLESDQLKKERSEKERLENERLEKERLINEKLAAEKLEKERLEKQRLEKERLINEKLALEKLEKERLEKDRLEQERIIKEKLAAEKLEKERVEREKTGK